MSKASGDVRPGDRSVESERQRRLLALLSGAPDTGGPGLAGSAAESQRGLAAYRANAATLAERALEAAYPTVAQLMGTESFAALARMHWYHNPPQRGDLAWWGECLPEAIEHDPQLASEPYLADVARLDWAVHRAGYAADDEGLLQGLNLLADTDPAQLRLRLCAGTAVVVSPQPIVDIWRAHHDPQLAGQAAADVSADGFVAARRALLEGRAQAAWVTRAGGNSVRTLLLDLGGARFTEALLRACTLEDALVAAGAAFDFEAWLILALREDALAEVQLVPPAMGPGTGPG